MQKVWEVSTWLLILGLLLPTVVHAEKPMLPFHDISKHWAKPSIIRGVQAGLFATGGKIQQFYPERYMTRAEFLTLLDRLLYEAQPQLYPLTFMSEHEEYSRGDGFDEPDLPYTDVDRLTWMYNPIIRVSVVLDRLYGPEALQQIFNGTTMQPEHPITREEVAQLLQMFTLPAEKQQGWEAFRSLNWLQGEKAEKLKRGEAAVLADKLIGYLQGDVVLPLLNYDGEKYPVVPQIQDVFPLFATYAANSSADEQTYINSVEAIRNHEDDEQTFEELAKLATASFPNQIGVHYYLSWNPNGSLDQNLAEAFAAIDAYFVDKIILPDTLNLLSANVYDIALQIEAEKPGIYEETLDQLLRYEQKMQQDSKEWESYAIYLAAFETKSGKLDDALKRYQALVDRTEEGLINTVYYLVQNQRLDDAKALLAEVEKPKRTEQLIQLQHVLLKELDTLREQKSYVTDLAYSIKRLDQLSGYEVNGESMLSGFLFKYAYEVDQQAGFTHTTGFYQSPNKLVLDKLEMYSDDQRQLQYLHEFDQQKWTKTSTGSIDYLHEWVESKTIYERAAELHSRYYKQSFGSYDIITEWIPGEELHAKSAEISLSNGKLKRVPVYMNKYYIDRETDMLVQHVWR